MTRRWRMLRRLLTIQKVLARYGLDEIILAAPMLRPVSLLYRLHPRNWRRRRYTLPVGVRIRLALEELGPIFVKFGQVVSTRRDLLPPEIADELVKLQDQVPPFPAEQAVAQIEEALGAPVDQLFARFDREPMAAASIAQVHSAQLRDGTEVVVKVLRPGMRETIARDLDVMYALAGLTARYWREGWRLRPVEVVAEYEKTVMDELDLMREAANASQLKRNFAGSDMLYVPEVYWDYCRVNVLVLERIYGLHISDMAGMLAAGTDIRRLAHNGVHIFFTQVFRHNFFHADMHPGNIFVDVRDPKRPRYAAVDFGIIGSLSDNDQHYLAENFLAFFKRDFHRVARLHVDSGWVPAGTSVQEFESAIRTVCEPIFNKPLKEISFGQVLLRLFETARRFNMQVQPQLVLLQKTLLNIEGLGRQLYPDLDLWETAQPVLEDWMRDRVSPLSALRRMYERYPEISQNLQTLPPMLYTLIRRAAEGDAQFRVQDPQLSLLQTQLHLQHRQRYGALAGGVLLLAGAMWLGLDAGWPPLGWGLGVLGVWLLIRSRPRGWAG